jgi:hypothetical protein
MIDKGTIYILQKKGKQKKNAESYRKRKIYGIMKEKSWKKTRK